MNRPEKYILIYPESHDHLGLFEDLRQNVNVTRIIASQKVVHSRILRGIRKVHTSWTVNKRINLPLKKIWYKPIIIEIDESIDYCLIFVDIAISFIDKSMLQGLCRKPNVRCVLVCINSINASSVGMLQIRNKVFQIPWDDVYSFDPGDREKYGFKDVKNCYYSQHDLPQQEIENDVFFAGGLKGAREDFIIRMFQYLRSHGVKCEFYISARKEEMLHDPPFRNEIHYYTGGWKPYEEILTHDLRANVIVEIMQENQTGPSLRYYEAVCYNKKLITTNMRAAELPYFNPEYMKIIRSPEDIDIEWVKRRDMVDYEYQGDFSPIHLLNVVME